MALSSPGIGSGLDVNSIVSQLIAVDSKPLTLLAQKEASFQAKLSAIGNVKGALSSFQSIVSGLSDLGKFQAVKASVVDSTIATATAGPNATPGSYALEVTQLAQAQKLATVGQLSSTTAIGSGTATTLSFDFGTISGGTLSAGKYTGATFTSNASGIKTVTIDASNNSLAGIRDAINSAKIGVNATIVNDGSGTPFRLVLTQGSVGASNSLKISVSGDAALSNLLSQDPAASQSLTENISAQNALIKVDGIAVSKSTNTVTDAIPGVTLNLAGKTAPGATTSVSVARDSAAVSSAVAQFVSGFNQLNKTLTDVSSYDPVSKQGAILNGDSTIRLIKTQLRNLLNAPVNTNGSSAYNGLSQIGVSLQKDGTLSLDNTKLQAAIDTNFGDIASLFASVGKSTDSLVAYSAATANTKPGTYAISVSQLARQGSATGLAAVTGAGSGTTTGSAAAGLTIDTTNNTLSVLLDGVTSTVTLTSGVYASAAALASNVQTQINANAAFTAAGSSVTVTNNLGVLTITSNKTGSASGVQVTGGNGALNLLGSTPAVNAGYDTSITTGVNDTLNVQVNGITNTITLAAGKYSFASIAAALQGQINGATAFSAAAAAVSVSQTAGILTVKSANYGSASSVAFTGGTALATLFGGTPSVIAGLDVAGTINGITAAGSGQFLTGPIGATSEGLKLNVIGGALGARGTVTYSQGYGTQLNTLITGLLASPGLLSAKTDGVNASIKSISKSRDQLNLVLAANEKRYRTQFSALDSVISGLQKTSSFLTQQLANLPKPY